MDWAMVVHERCSKGYMGVPGERIRREVQEPWDLDFIGLGFEATLQKSCVLRPGESVPILLVLPFMYP